MTTITSIIDSALIPAVSVREGGVTGIVYTQTGEVLYRSGAMSTRDLALAAARAWIDDARSTWTLLAYGDCAALWRTPGGQYYLGSLFPRPHVVALSSDQARDYYARLVHKVQYDL